MDKWSPDQLAKMKAGGNPKFLDFMRSYGSEGGYREEPPMTIREKYNTWAAKEYREKVSCSPEARGHSLICAPSHASSSRTSLERNGPLRHHQRIGTRLLLLPQALVLEALAEVTSPILPRAATRLHPSHLLRAHIATKTTHLKLVEVKKSVTRPSLRGSAPPTKIGETTCRLPKEANTLDSALDRLSQQPAAGTHHTRLLLFHPTMRRP